MPPGVPGDGPADAEDRVSTPIITNSQMRCFRRCPREHYYTYTLGYRGLREAAALRFGSLVHVGLEAYFRALKAGASTLDALATALAAIAASPDADVYERARAVVALQGYDAMWAGEPLEVLDVEAEFRAALVNPESGAPSRTFQLGGKLDVLVRDLRDGRVKLMEHKTTSEEIGAGSDYWKRLKIDPQVSTYFAGGTALGHTITECIYDVLGKPALRPSAVPVLDDDGLRIVLNADGQRVRTQKGAWRQTGSTDDGFTLQTRPETPEEFAARLVAHVAENPQRYYQRGTVVRLEQEMLDAAHDSWAIARQIREAELASRWPRNPDACVRYGRTCGFFDVCTGAASLDDPLQFRRVEHVHQELTPDAA